MSSQIPLIDQLMQQAGYHDPEVDQALGSYNSTDRMINGKVNPSYGMSFADFQKEKNYQTQYRQEQQKLIQGAMGKGYTLEDLGIYDQPDAGQAVYNAYRDQNQQLHNQITSGQIQDAGAPGNGGDINSLASSLGIQPQQQTGNNNGSSLSNSAGSMTSADGTNLNSAPGVGVVNTGKDTEYLAPGQYTRLDGAGAFNNLSTTNPNPAPSSLPSAGGFTPAPNPATQNNNQQAPSNQPQQQPNINTPVTGYITNPNQSGSGFSNINPNGTGGANYSGGQYTIQQQNQPASFTNPSPASSGSFPGLGSNNTQKQQSRPSYGGANYGG